MLVLDYLSHVPEIILLEEITAEHVIMHMKSIFARHGIPEVVMSDNGPQSDGYKFRQFVNKYGFKHITSSPRYPQSNGVVENGVKNNQKSA